MQVSMFQTQFMTLVPITTRYLTPVSHAQCVFLNSTTCLSLQSHRSPETTRLPCLLNLNPHCHCLCAGVGGFCFHLLQTDPLAFSLAAFQSISCSPVTHPNNHASVRKFPKVSCYLPNRRNTCSLLLALPPALFPTRKPHPIHVPSTCRAAPGPEPSVLYLASTPSHTLSPCWKCPASSRDTPLPTLRVFQNTDQFTCFQGPILMASAPCSLLRSLPSPPEPS